MVSCSDLARPMKLCSKGDIHKCYLVAKDGISGSHYSHLLAACLNYLDYFTQFDLFGKVSGLLQHGQLFMILSSRLNERVEMCLSLSTDNFMKTFVDLEFCRIL